jgi:putative Holliday junction resolvase
MRTILGFDFGQKNIGVAIGQELTKTASELTVIKARDGIPNWDDIEKLIKQWQP